MQPPTISQKTIIAALLAAALLFAGQPLAANEQVDAVFADYDSTQLPGCTLGVYRQGKLEYARGYGMANLEYGIANDLDSVFRIASVSKQFVAMAIALLDEAGKLDLDDPIQKYFPNMPDYGAPVTLRQMIHHTSGMRDYLTLAWLADWGEWYLPADAIALIERQQNLNFPPGSDYLYSNSGYLLLGAVVEQVTGKSLRQWSDENIFAPLGMRNTHFQDDHTRLVKRRADGYGLKEGAWHINMTQLDMVGDGGVYTTVGDLLLWHNNFADNRLGKGRQKLIELMETPAVLSNGESSGYAFGLGINEYMGTREVEHGGSWVGFRVSLNRYPERDLGIAVLCNRDDADPEFRARQVAALYLAGDVTTADQPATTPDAPPAAIVLSEAQLSALTGEYWQVDDMLLRAIRVQDGKLVYDRLDGRVSELAAVSARAFEMKDTGTPVSIRFEPADGPAQQMSVRVGDEAEKALRRIEREAPAASVLSGFAGNYYSVELGHRQTITLTADGLVAERRRGPEPLEHVIEDLFTTSEGAILAFDRDAQGEVSGFHAHAGRVRNLAYLKE